MKLLSKLAVSTVMALTALSSWEAKAQSFGSGSAPQTCRIVDINFSANANFMNWVLACRTLAQGVTRFT